ncbi:MAG: winged helix-turn-helix domain-containing protein [Dehalococcoidia bacterium]
MPAEQDPREMTDQEVMKWMQDLITRLTDEKGSAGGACNFEAVKPPVRRRILHALEERALETNEISKIVGVAGMALKYHLNVLMSGYFIQIEGNRVDLTPGGVSVVRSDNRRMKKTAASGNKQ